MALRTAPDSAPAAWVVAGLRGFAQDVRSVVPEGFEAYCRVFHPAYRLVEGTLVGVRWSEIASEIGTVVHAEMQWPGITAGERRPAATWDVPPSTGDLPVELQAVVSRCLAAHTTTPDRCWFAVWEGFGGLPSAVRLAPAFEIPARRMHLFEGHIGDSGTSFSPSFHQSANLWWPDDQAWCVATEIDFVTTYVGGTVGCITDLVNEPELEALRLPPTAGVTYASDSRNVHS